LTTEHYLYVSEIDLSIDNGPGINEREGVDALTKFGSNRVTCMVPYPKSPGNYLNPKVVYVYPHHSSLIRYLVYLFASLIEIWKVNRKRPLDAVIFRLGMTPFVPWMVSLLIKKPMILKTLAGHSLYEIRQRPLPSRTMGMVTYAFTQRFIKTCHAADTVSLQYLNWIEKTVDFKKDRLVHIPNGVNTDFFKPGDIPNPSVSSITPELDYVLGYVGALEGLRHIQNLITSLQTLQHLGRVGLLLIGDGSQRRYLEKLTDSLNLSDRVIFTGNVPYSDVPGYMNRFDIAFDLSMVPLRFGNKVHYASFSQKIPQYLACGLPVITWDTLDTRFLENERIGSCVAFSNKDQITVEVAKLLSMDPAQTKRMHKRARSYALNHLSTEILALTRIAFWNRVRSFRSGL